MVCYKPPKMTPMLFRERLSNQREFLPKLPTLIIGDFSEDLLQRHSVICNLLCDKGFKQHVSVPTHIHGGLLDRIYTRDIEPSIVNTSFMLFRSHGFICCILIQC